MEGSGGASIVGFFGRMPAGFDLQQMAASTGMKGPADGPASEPSGAETRCSGRPERIAFFAVTALAILYLIIVITVLSGRARTSSFSNYYASALVLREGGDPYATNLTAIGARLGLKISQIDRSTDTPTFLLCFSPLTRLPIGTADVVWQTFSIITLIVGLAILLRSAVSRRAARWLVLGIIFFAPVELHLASAQSRFLVFTLLVGAIVSVENSHEAQAGLILAAATLLRAYPLAMSACLVARRHWKALGWMAAGGLVTVAALGLHTCLESQAAIKLITERYFLVQPSNIAFGSFVSRIRWRAFDAGLIAPHESIRKAVSLACDAMLGLAALAITWMKNALEFDPDRRAYSL